MPGWMRRLRGMLGRDRSSGEKREELQFHFDMEVEAGVRAGLSPEDARRRARWRAGLVADGMESTREALGIRWIDGMWTDLASRFTRVDTQPGLRNGCRPGARGHGCGQHAHLLHARGGGAACAALPSLQSGWSASTTPARAPRSSRCRSGTILHYRANARALDCIALYTGMDMELSSTGGHSKRLTGVAITPEYFAVLGKAPLLGRAFTASDQRKGGRHVILSARVWLNDFQA